MQTCQNCKSNFEITSEDLGFYSKIKVPPPTWCPECRQKRRYAWRNERTLYRRNCDLCKKSMVTIYSPNKPYKVYCHDCWWGDNWDFTSYGRDFDFSRPFFEQFAELQHDVPRLALLNKNSTNSEYTNHSGNNKNAYLSYCIFDSENIMHSTYLMNNCRDCVDCSHVHEKGERLYEIIDSRTCYQCQYSFLLKDCSSCFYCYDCRGCNDCFLSYNLRNKSYVFKNQQYNREEYFKKIKEFELSSFSVRQGLEKEYLNMMEQSAIHRYVISERNINSTGSMLYDCKNVTYSFEVDAAENQKYVYSGINMKDCMDIYHAGYNFELCYECHGCTRLSNCIGCHLCYDGLNVSYSDTCQNSQNLFGCVSVKKGEYLIFNKKYSKEEYEKLKEKIIEHMRKTGEYGEFFPPQIAPICYNETQGNLYAPMTKDEVLLLDWKWEENIQGTFGRETIPASQIPDKIGDVPESYINEIFACTICSKNFNVTKNELLFYQKEKVPFPRKCPNCRFKVRFDLRPARRLWHRKCMKEGRSDSESPQTRMSCENEFETTYKSERKEKVYCEKCYQQEVY